MKKQKKIMMVMGFLLMMILLLTSCGETKKYTVYFEGADIEAVQVIQDKLLDKPTDPTKEGFNFKGWYLDSNFEQEFDFDIMPITNNMTLYAKWEEKPYVKTDEDLVLEARNSLSLGNVHNVTSNMTLPLSGLHGTTITWSSDNHDALKDDGTIIRPDYDAGNIVVNLTATITLNDASTTRTFSITILKAIQEYFTVKQVQKLISQQLVTVEGYVSAMSDRRMVIQDEEGIGIYIWLSGAKDELFDGQDINLGDKVKVFGEFRPGSPNQIDINNSTSGYYILKLEESQDVVYESLDYVDMEDFLSMDFSDVAGRTYEFKGVEIIKNSLTASYGQIIFFDESGIKIAVRVDGNMLPEVKDELILRDIQKGEIFDITMTFYGIDNGPIWSGILSKAEHIKESDDAHLYYALSKLDLHQRFEVYEDLEFINELTINNKEITINYNSNNENVISNEGIVNRIVGNDEVVTITITLIDGDLTLTKEVDFKVIGDISFEDKLLELKDTINLLDEYLVDFSLPISGIYDSTITWTSSNNDVISIDGNLAEVNIPLNDEVVTLTANVSFLGSDDIYTIDYDVLVPAVVVTDEFIVDLTLNGIEFNQLTIVEDINLNFDNPYNVNISFSSSDDLFLSETGKVTRHGYVDKTIEFTVTVNYKEVTKDKTFEFTISKIEGHTIDDFYNLDRGSTYDIKGIVAAKGPSRIVLQDLDGRGMYIWLGAAQVDAYASDVKVGDFVVARGQKAFDNDSQMPQLNINNLSSGYNVTNYGVIPGLTLENPTVVEGDNLESLSLDFNDLQGYTYQFNNIEIMLVDSNRIVFYSYDEDNYVAIRVSSNMLPDVLNKVRSLDLKVGDIISFKGTFYNIDHTNKAAPFFYSLIIAEVDDIELVESAGQFVEVKDDIKPLEVIEDELILKFNSLHDSTITWSSNDPVITITGEAITINRPIKPQLDKEVTLTAVVDISGNTKTYTFDVLVLAELSDLDKVLEAKNNLEFSFDLNEVVLDFTLVLVGLHQANITWSSSDNNIIEVDQGVAIVKRSTIEDKEVTLIATITLNSESTTKSFEMTVIKGEMTDQEKVDNATNNFTLDLAYDSDLDSYLLKDDINLPLLYLGVNITWLSSDIETLTNNGKYKESYYNETVTLTGTFNLNDVTAVLTFNLHTEEQEGYTASEFYDLANGPYYLLKGIVAAKGPSRMVVQDPSGEGFYIWLGAGPMNHFAKDINVGDFIKVKGTKSLDSSAQLPQINVNSTTDPNKYLEKISSDHKYELAAPIVIDSSNLNDLPEDFKDLQGKTYLFTNITLLDVRTNGLHLIKDGNEEIILKISGNLLPEVLSHLNSLNLVVGDVINLKGTFYSKDGNLTNSAMILANPSDIELVEASGKFSQIEDDIKPIEVIEDELTLKFNSLYDSTIIWSSNSNYINIEGGVVTINNPIKPLEDEQVTLTAIVTIDDITKEYTFEVTVTSIYSNEDKVAQAKTDLEFNFDLDNIILDFELLLIGLHGTSITWSSSNEDVIEIDNNIAVVKRSLVEDKDVTLTATITLGDVSLTKDFEMIVIQGEQSDEEKVDNAINNFQLDLVFIEENNAYLLDRDIVLVEEYLGVQISWLSNDDEVLTNSGTYMLPFYKEELTLTATFTLNDVAEELVFVLETSEVEGYTVDDFHDSLVEGLVYEIKGIVAAKSTNRLVIQTPEGRGLYIWLNAPQMDEYASDVTVGDLIVAKGLKTKDGQSGMPQLNINDKTSGYNVTNYGSNPKYNVASPIVVTADTLENLPADFESLQGRTYNFVEVEVLLKDTHRFVVYDYNNNRYIAVRTSGGNMLPEVLSAYNSLDIKVGDIVTFTGTFYNIDDGTKFYSMIISNANEIEVI